MTPSWIVRGSSGLLSVFVLVACEAKPSPRPSPTVAEVRVVPNPVTLLAGAAVQLAAEVDDGDGHPIGGARIAFLSSDPSKLEVTPTGLVQSAGPAGPAQIVVESGDKETRVPVTIAAGLARKLEAVSGGGQSAIVETSLPEPLVVRVLDGYGNPMSGSNVSFLPADGGVAEPHSSATNTSGEASARWKLGPGAGAQALSASIEAPHVPAATFSAHAETGPPAKLSGTSEPGVAASGEVSHALAVKVTDASGNPKEGVTVSWRLETSGGKLSSETSASDASGIARVVVSTGGRARGQRVAAGIGDLATVIEVPAK